MPFLAYLVVFVVTVFSVGLEWHWLVEPPAPARHATRAVNESAVQTAPARPSPENGIAIQRPAYPANPAGTAPVAKQNQKLGAAPATGSPSVAGADQPQGAQQDSAGAQGARAAPQCDVSACASAYHTFRASDCTYQPFDGPRRLCTKGAPAQAAADARAESAVPRCHIRSCAEAYSSFNPGDCTYQPLDGPRRLCEK